MGSVLANRLPIFAMLIIGAALLAACNADVARLKKKCPDVYADVRRLSLEFDRANRDTCAISCSRKCKCAACVLKFTDGQTVSGACAQARCEKSNTSLIARCISDYGRERPENKSKLLSCML
jgi:hypothetical protein